MAEIFLKDPGFVPNGPDGMSCMHACMQMVMRANPAGRVFSFDQINKILRRKPGLYSWMYGIAESISQEGFQIRSISTFSTERFVEEGESYLLEYLGAEAGQVQINNSDIPTVREDARKFLDSNNVEIQQRVPTLDDIRTHIRNGWYMVPLVNSDILNSRQGYSGHFIFIYGFDDESIHFHDPGPPPHKGRKVTWELFDKAWSSPSEQVRSVDCFFLSETKH